MQLVELTAFMTLMILNVLAVLAVRRWHLPDQRANTREIRRQPTIAALAGMMALGYATLGISVPPAKAEEPASTQLALVNFMSDRPVTWEVCELDSLSPNSNFTTFMTDDCPEDVRIKALRRLWTLLPPANIDFSSAM